MSDVGNPQNIIPFSIIMIISRHRPDLIAIPKGWILRGRSLVFSGCGRYSTQTDMLDELVQLR